MNNRIYYLDVAKVIGTFLVVFAHLYSYESSVRIPIYAFHMPFFFVVSGIFHKHNGTIQIVKYFMSLLVPTTIFIFLALLYDPLLAYIFEGGSLLEHTEVFLRRTAIGFIKGSNIGIYWFLIVLFLCKVMFDFFLKSNMKKPIILFLLFLLLVSYFTRLPLYISQTVMAMPFYILGYQFRDKFKALSLERIGKCKICIYIVMCFVCTIVLSILNGKVSMVAIKFGCLPFPLNIVTFYANAIIGTLLILLASLFLRHRFDFINTVSLSLITIVGIQGLFTHAIKYIWGYDQSIIYSAFIAIMIIIVCSFIHKPLSKLYP